MNNCDIQIFDSKAGGQRAGNITLSGYDPEFYLKLIQTLKDQLQDTDLIIHYTITE